MSTRTTDPLLLAGRVLTFIMQGLMALVGIILAFLLPVLVFFREKISAELIVEHGEKAADIPALQVFAILLIAIGCAFLAFRFFGKLRRIIETVEEGDPFVPDNADRLTAMAWHLTAIYGLFAVIGLIAISMSSFVAMIGDGNDGAVFGFDLSAILTIVILFILARVFRKGTEMRDDLEGTV